MMEKRKIVLFNPPGSKIYIRDYYCSKVSKAYYYPQPVDLLMQSAYFPEEKYDLTVIDAIAEKKDIEEVLHQLLTIQPGLIVGLLGSVSLNDDIVAYEKVKATLPDVKIACSGDALLDDYEKKLEAYPWMDVIITNFYLDGVRQWYEAIQNPEGVGQTSFLGIGYAVRKPEEAPKFMFNAGKISGKLTIPVPKQTAFKGNYRMPFANAEPIATVLTNYACPYPCTFCIMSKLPYATRTAESIINELKYLKVNGYRFVYFSDQTFFQSKVVTREVLNWMIQSNFGLNWMCFSRVDVVDDEDLKLMKTAGCSLIMFGVEWAENELLEKYKKHYTIDQIKKTFATCKKLGIKRLGTFLIGVPGQTRQSILDTIKFAKDIDADYASFNVAVPRSQTVFREEALEMGLIDEHVKMMDQSGDVVVMGNGVLTKTELQNLKVKAYRSFYFRPSYLLKRLFSIRSGTEFKFHLVEGWYILKGLIIKKR